MVTVATLILAGAALLFLETLLPGMIAGIAGLGCLVSGVIVSYVNFGARTGNLVLILVVAGTIVATVCWMKYFPETRLARLFISRGSVGDIGTERPELLNQTGAALTTLRPSGTAVINGKRVDVVTEGSLIEAGTPVKVVAVEGMRVVVRVC